MITPTAAMENTSGARFGSPSPPPSPHMLGVGGWGKVFTAQRKKDVHKPGSKREARRPNYSGKLSLFSVLDMLLLPPWRRNSHEAEKKDGKFPSDNKKDAMVPSYSSRSVDHGLTRGLPWGQVKADPKASAGRTEGTGS